MKTYLRVRPSLTGLPPSQLVMTCGVTLPTTTSQVEFRDTLLQGVLEGTRHHLILAYGQTGTGKTHSVLGPPGTLMVADGVVPESWGLFPFAAASWVRSGKGRVTVTAVEVYMDKLYDLLNNRVPITTGSVCATPHRTDWTRGGVGNRVAEETAPERAVLLSDVADVAKVARTIEATRSAVQHKLNARSSRSHCLITLTLQVVGRGDLVTTRRVIFADLAGSERVKKSGVVDDASGGARSFALTANASIDLPQSRFDEAKCVNRSLAALGRVLRGLTTSDPYVPYRDTPLTLTLKPFLEGNATDVRLLLTTCDEKVNDGENCATMRFGATLMGATSSSTQRRTSVVVAPITRAEMLSARMTQAENLELEIEKMIKRGKAGGLDSAKAARPTQLQFLSNQRKLEAARETLRGHKERGLDGGAPDPRLAQAEHAVNIYLGLVARQMTTGMWVPPDAALLARQRVLERLRSEIVGLQ